MLYVFGNLLRQFNCMMNCNDIYFIIGMFISGTFISQILEHFFLLFSFIKFLQQYISQIPGYSRNFQGDYGFGLQILDCLLCKCKGAV